MGRYCSILIIDDEFIMRQGMKHMLEWEKYGFQISGEASNGQEGLDLVEKLHPDIVLADIVMPVLDGIEFSAILRERYPDVKLIILSSYDKFEYVKTTLMNGAADYILKPTLNAEILLKTLRKAAKEIPGMNLQEEQQISHHSQVERFLSGYQERLDEAAFAEKFPYTLYRLFAIDLKKACASRKDKMAQVQEMIVDFFDKDTQYSIVPVFIEEEILCMVLNYRINWDARMMEYALSCVEKVTKIYENAFFVMSSSFSNMQEMKTCYAADIKGMVPKQFYYPSQHILVLDKHPERASVKRFELEQYSRYISHRQFEEAMSMFREYMNYLCTQQEDEYKVKNLAKNLIYIYLEEVSKYEELKDEYRENYFMDVDGARYVDGLLSVIHRMISELEKLQGGNSDLQDTRILEIKKYIREHYNEQLELAEIAEKFNFNYNYLSYYLNEHTNEGFSEYLNKIRVEKACEFLRNRVLTIADVSGKVGYSDQSYFCRVFKRLTGETPSTYRRHLHQGEG